MENQNFHIKAYLSLTKLADATIACKFETPLKFQIGEDPKIKANIRHSPSEEVFSLVGYTATMSINGQLIAGAVSGSTAGTVDFTFTATETNAMAAGTYDALIVLTDTAASESTFINVNKGIEVRAVAT